jgi:hypothetical protein
LPPRPIKIFITSIASVADDTINIEIWRLNMGDEVAVAGEARGLAERLAARLPGVAGYLERELQRELDQRVRAELAARLDHARGKVLAFVRSLDLADLAAISALGSIDKSLDSAASALRGAGAGYAGLFDAVKIRQDQLVAVYRHDLGLLDDVERVEGATDQLTADVTARERLSAAIADVRAGIQARTTLLHGVLGK